jgi:hypothetical protein
MLLFNVLNTDSLLLKLQNVYYSILNVYKLIIFSYCAQNDSRKYLQVQYNLLIIILVMELQIMINVFALTQKKTSRFCNSTKTLFPMFVNINSLSEDQIL